MRTMKTGWFIPCLVLASLLAAAQDQAKTDIKHVAIKPTSPASGAQMYKAYCAVCHGADGKGNGPAAEALKTPPTDLTTLAARNDGKYPMLRVSAILGGEEMLPAHGSKDMPIWGELFWGMSAGHESEVQQRVTNLTKYLESMQKK